MKNTEKSHQFIQLGPLNESLMQYVFELPDGRKAPGKIFLGDKIGLTGMEISVNSLPAGVSVPFYHRHKAHEEIYIVLSGKGEMWVDNETIAMEEGVVIKIDPAGVRQVRNAGSDRPLNFLVLQARAGSLEGVTDIEDGELVEQAA